MADSKYILIDKVYLELINSYQIDLYDTVNGVVKRILAPITERINLTSLGDIEDELKKL